MTRTRQELEAMAAALEQLVELHKDSQVGTGIKASALLLARDYHAEAQALSSHGAVPVAEVLIYDDFQRHVNWLDNGETKDGTLLYTSPPAAKVDEGWQLVPKEPTIGMVARGGAAIQRYKHEDVRPLFDAAVIYKAMLYAAPAGEEG